MALKVAAVVIYMLLSGCLASPYLEDNGWAPANDQGRDMFAEEDAVKNLYSALKDAEANGPETQEAVDNDPYWNWGNYEDVETESNIQGWQDTANDLDGQQQDFSDWDNAMDGQLQDVSDWDNAPEGQNQDFSDWGEPAPEETVGMQENDNLDWGWGEMQGHEEPGDNQPSDSDTSNPGVPAVEQDLSPDDIMVQFFNHPGDPQVLEQEVDWNDRDFLKEETEANGQGMDWNIPEENNEAMPQDMDWNDDTFLTDQAEDHVQSQGETWFREAEPLEQEYMKNGDMPSDANIEELWNELNEMEQPHVQNTASDINAQVDAIYKEMSKTQEEIKKLEKLQQEEGDLSKCLQDICTECGVEEICVRKNERGDCVSKEPKVKICCEKGYEPRCKSEREEASDRRGKEIEKLSEKLSEMEKKLVELTEQQKKAENNP